MGLLNNVIFREIGIHNLLILKKFKIRKTVILAIIQQALYHKSITSNRSLAPSLYSSALKNFKILDAARVDEFFDHTTTRPSLQTENPPFEAGDWRH